MDVYIPLVFYIIFVSLFFSKKKLLLTFLTFVPLLIFIGTRVGLGVDYEGYQADYDMLRDYDFATYFLVNIDGKFEPGFYFLIKLMPSYNSLVFFVSFIYVASIAFFFYKQFPGRYYFLAFLLWLFYPFFFESFVAMRSSIALSFFLLACCAKKDGKQILAIAIVLLSALFHMSGILLLIPILVSSKFLDNHLSVLAPAIFFFAIVVLLVPSVVSSSLKNVFMMNQNYGAAYENYIVDSNGGVGFYLQSFVRLIFICYIITLQKKGLIVGWLSWIAWVTILYYLLLMIQGVEITYRFGTYLFLISVVFKCYVIRIDKSYASKIYLVLSILYSLYYFYDSTNSVFYEKYFHHYHSFLFNI